MKKNHHLHRLVRLCLIISLLLLCSTSQVFAAAKVNLKNTKIKLSATKLTYNQKVQRPKVSVTYKGKVLKEKKNYVLKYSKGCKKVGTYTVQIIGLCRKREKAVYHFASKDPGNGWLCWKKDCQCDNKKANRSDQRLPAALCHKFQIKKCENHNSQRKQKQHRFPQWTESRNYILYAGPYLHGH